MSGLIEGGLLQLVGGSLTSATVRGAALLACACLLAFALRRGPARARQLLWASSLLGLMALPALAALLPAWQPAVPVPAYAEPLLDHLAAAEPLLDHFAAAVSRRDRQQDPEARAVQPADRWASPPDLAGSLPAALAERGAGPPPGASGVASSTGPSAGSSAGLSTGPGASSGDRTSAAIPLHELQLWRLVLGLWLAVAVPLTIAQLVGLLRLRRLARRAVEVRQAGWRLALLEARECLGLTRPVRLLSSPEIATPMTWGLLRPVVLLPAGCVAWGGERRRMVLLHELVHIRRGDWLVRTLARFACAVHWLNPLAWLALRRLTIEQEIACDDAVLELGTRPSRYASLLLELATLIRLPRPTLGRQPTMALDMARRTQMEGRVMSILDPKKSTRRSRLLLPVIALMVALVGGLAAVHPRLAGAADPQDDLDAALSELAALDRELEPFEERLEAIEAELEPFEGQLEAIEEEMEPLADALEGIEDDLDPYEEQLEAVEAELEPFEEQLEAIEGDLEPFEGQLEAIEEEMEAVMAELEEVELDMGPFEEQLEALDREMEGVEERLEAIEEEEERIRESGTVKQLEALQQRRDAVIEEMEPFHRRMAEIHQRMRPAMQRMAAAHERLRPYYERMSAVHEQMRPVHERMSAVHERMRPVHERMSAVHEQMRPVHERMSERHAAMRPYYERMSAVHERMRPVHERMSAVHEQMRPLYERMRGIHERLRAAVAADMAALIEERLGAAARPGADFRGAGEQIVERADYFFEDGRVSLRITPAEVEEVLAPLAVSGGGATLQEAVRAVVDYDVPAPGN